MLVRCLNEPVSDIKRPPNEMYAVLDSEAVRKRGDCRMSEVYLHNLATFSVKLIDLPTLLVSSN